MKYLGLIFCILGLVACGGTPAASTEGAPEIATVSNQVPWQDMGFTQRKDYMKSAVMPKMAALFVEMEPDMNCTACHGDNGNAVNFKMPNTLEPLDPNNMPFTSEDAAEQQVAMWMKETIVPEMAGLLHTTAYNPSTHEGFGCFGCHATTE